MQSLETRTRIALCLLALSLVALTLATEAAAFQATYQAYCANPQHGEGGWRGACHADAKIAAAEARDHQTSNRGHRVATVQCK
jgi:ABC-type sugar transport system substrate-binding protein